MKGFFFVLAFLATFSLAEPATDVLSSIQKMGYKSLKGRAPEIPAACATPCNIISSVIACGGTIDCSCKVESVMAVADCSDCRTERGVNPENLAHEQAAVNGIIDTCRKAGFTIPDITLDGHYNLGTSGTTATGGTTAAGGTTATSPGSGTSMASPPSATAQTGNAFGLEVCALVLAGGLALALGVAGV